MPLIGCENPWRVFRDGPDDGSDRRSPLRENATRSFSRAEIDDEQERTIRIFVAGRTGAVGARLVPMLVSEGYMTWWRSLASRPEVIVHQLTALAATGDIKRFDR